MPVRAPHEPPSSHEPPELVALTARSPPTPIPPSANPPSGNAPASKLLTYGTAAASLLTHYSRAHHRVGLTPRGLFARGELLSRWLTSQFAFTSPGEACIGLYLLYSLRDVERVRGTRRHATRLLIAAVVSLVIQTLLCADVPPRSMARARRFIRHPKLLLRGLCARTSLPRRRAPRSGISHYVTDAIRVHDGWSEVWGQGVHVVGGFAAVLEPRRAFARPRRRGRDRIVRRRVGGDWSGLDPPEWACAIARATFGRVLGVDGGGVGGRPVGGDGRRRRR